jgi:hypothetical protein
MKSLTIHHQENERTFRILALFLAILVLNALDLVYTLFAHRIGMLDEVNPLAETFLRLGLTPSLICYKLLLVLCGLMILWRLRLSRWVPAALWLLVFAYVALSVMWYLWVKDVTYIYETQASAATPLRHGVLP